MITRKRSPRGRAAAGMLFVKAAALIASIAAGSVEGGCDGAAGRPHAALALSEAPTNVWATWGGNAARSFRGKDLPLSRRPRIAWTNTCLAGHSIQAAAASETSLFLVGRRGPPVSDAIGWANAVTAVSLEDGHRLWVHKDDALAKTFSDEVFLSDGKLFLATVKGLLALNSETGDILWRREENWTESRAANCVKADASAVYVSFKSGEVAAFDKEDGRVIWRCPSGAVNAPIVYRNTVIAEAGSRDEPRLVVGLSAADGHPQWRTELLPLRPSEADGEAYVSETGFPTACDGMVLVTAIWGPVSWDLLGLSSYVAGLDADTGKVVWRSGLPGSGAYEVASDGARLYVGCASGDVVCFDQRSGKRLWKSRPPQWMALDPRKGDPWPLTLPVVVSGETVLVATAQSGELFGLSAADGTVLWDITLPDEMFSSDQVLVAGGYVVVINGAQVWVLEPVARESDRYKRVGRRPPAATRPTGRSTRSRNRSTITVKGAGS